MLRALRKGKMKEVVSKLLRVSILIQTKREEGKTTNQINPARLNQVEHSKNGKGGYRKRS